MRRKQYMNNGPDPLDELTATLIKLALFFAVIGVGVVLILIDLLLFHGGGATAAALNAVAG